MRRFIRLSYHGGNYHGWQRQPNAPSVQQTIEEALGKVLRRPVQVTGAGRTDTGVHARCMYAHFDFQGELPVSDIRLTAALNTMCGRDISVSEVFPVDDDLHARFSAKERTYRYFVHYGKNPFLEGLSWQSPSQLDVQAMNSAAAMLAGVEDFTSFAKLHSDSRTNICHVTRALWTPFERADGTPGIMFEISADRFLRNMVRAVVGTLVEVGRGRTSHDGFREIIEAKDRCRAGNSMPAHALYLWSIKYNFQQP